MALSASSKTVSLTSLRCSAVPLEGKGWIGMKPNPAVPVCVCPTISLKNKTDSASFTAASTSQVPDGSWMFEADTNSSLESRNCKYPLVLDAWKTATKLFKGRGQGECLE